MRTPQHHDTRIGVKHSAGSERWTYQAARMPPMAPKRWPVKEMPGPRQQAPQDAAVQHEHGEPAEDPQQPAGEEAADDEVREVAEHQPAGADVDRARRAEQPRAEPARDGDDDGDLDEARDVAEGDERAEHEERDRVGEQVREARSAGTAPPGRRRARRPCAARCPSGRSPVPGTRSIELHGPHHGEHADDDQHRPQRLGERRSPELSVVRGHGGSSGACPGSSSA